MRRSHPLLDPLRAVVLLAALAPGAGAGAASPIGLLALQSSSTCIPEWLPTFGASPGTNGWINALAEFDAGDGTILVAGGSFTTAGAAFADGCAAWDGSRWSAIDGPSNVDALVAFDDGSGLRLYAGGGFAEAGGQPAANVAVWNGTSWSALGGGLDEAVHALAFYDDGSGPTLFAGGSFPSASGVPAPGIATWDGTTWASVGGGTNRAVFALQVFDDGQGPALFAGGRFWIAGGVEASGIARWDGVAWSALGSGFGDEVHALTVFDDGGGPALYAGGGTARFPGVHYVRRWNGTSWSELGSGVDGPVRALAVHDGGAGDRLYVGGSFATAGGLPAVGAARWDGSTWSPVGEELTDYANGSGVSALLSVDLGDGPALVAAGDFAFADESLVRGIVEWKGDGWEAFGNGIVGRVASLVVHDEGAGDRLFAGGEFELMAGAPKARHVARWDGTGWSALGLGAGGDVKALASFDDGSGSALYVGGDFLTVNGTIGVANVARWDGAAWSAVGSQLVGGFGDEVAALTVYDEGGGPKLHAGGAFTGLAHVARWDGTSWSSVGGGTSNRVFCLTVFDDGAGADLYAGGLFASAGGGVSASRIARWDGSTWSSVGGGVTGGVGSGSSVRAMAVFDDGSGPALYVGGAMGGAGGVGANNIARWNGSSWSGVGGGLNDMVTALSVFDDGSGPALYAGGRFGSAGGMPATLVARWDGTSWSALGGGMTASPSAEVDCLVAFDDGSGSALHAGGLYVGTIDSADSNLARWGCAKGGIAFCFGTDADCPCGNGGAPGRGCDNAQGTGGVELALVAQTTSSNGATVTGTGFSTMGAPTALVFRSAGLAATPVTFGDGLGCLAPAGVVRLAATTAIAGTSTHAFGHGAMAGGGDFYYQIWYRNTPSAYCTPAAFNLSNGLRIGWP